MPGHKGGMRRLAADIRRKAEDISFVELRRVRRSQIMADDDAWLLQVTKVNLIISAQRRPQAACSR